MTKILTTHERINNDAIYHKYWTVVRKMTVDEFHSAIRKHHEELRKNYDFNRFSDGIMLYDYIFALANLLLDHENSQSHATSELVD